MNLSDDVEHTVMVAFLTPLADDGIGAAYGFVL